MIPPDGPEAPRFCGNPACKRRVVELRTRDGRHVVCDPTELNVWVPVGWDVSDGEIITIVTTEGDTLRGLRTRPILASKPCGGYRLHTCGARR